MPKYPEIQIAIDGISLHTPVSELTVEQFVDLLVQVNGLYTPRQLMDHETKIPDSETMERVMRLIDTFHSDLAGGLQVDIHKRELRLIEQVMKEVGCSIRFPSHIPST